VSASHPCDEKFFACMDILPCGEAEQTILEIYVIQNIIWYIPNNEYI
jgi:hypothetical protein